MDLSVIERSIGNSDDALNTLLMLFRDRNLFFCSVCGQALSEHQLTEVRECMVCRTVFDGNIFEEICPECDSVCSRTLIDDGCPDCLGEDRCVSLTHEEICKIVDYCVSTIQGDSS